MIKNKFEFETKAGSINISGSDNGLGIWITNEYGQLNLCVQKNLPPYLAFYHCKNGNPISLKAVAALFADEHGDLIYQTKENIQYNLTELLEKVSKI